jgi:hypothetical protein
VATVLRPPLVFDRRQKRPIGYADVPPNLIASTLRNDVLTLIAPLAFEQLDDSAPPRKRQVRVDQTPNLLTSTLFATTEKLRLGPEQWDDSAPPRKWQARVDLVPNLLGTTLGGAAPPSLDLPLRVEMWDDGGQARKRQVLAEQFTGRAVWRDPVPRVAHLSDSATPRKRQTRVDTTPNPVVLLQPLIRGWFESAPPRVKARVMVDLPPSPNITALAPLPALTKPLGYPYDFSTPQLKYEIELDFTPNMLVLGITPAPEPVIPTPRRRGRIVVDKVSRDAIAAQAKREAVAAPRRRETLTVSKPRSALAPKKPRTIH